MIHTSLQIDPGADISIRPGQDGNHEIVILDRDGEASAVIRTTTSTLNRLAEVIGQVIEK